MAGRYVFIEIGREMPSPLFEAWTSSMAATGKKNERVSSFEDLAEVEVQAGDALVLPWSLQQAPEYVVELLCQDSRWAGNALIVVLEQLPPEVKEFLKEYSLTYLVSGRDLGKAVVDIARFADDDETKGKLTTFDRKRPPVPEIRRFFRELAAQEFEAADMRLASWLGALGEAETMYMKGLILKAAKDFEGAHKVLGQGLKETRKELRLEPRFLHLLGAVAFKRLDHANAKPFLEAADKVSPLNLRRQLMLAQLYVEMNLPAEALKRFRAILKRVPTYAGTHAKTVELGFQLSQTLPDVQSLKPVIEHVPPQKLAGLYRKAESHPSHQHREALATLIAQELVRHARRASEADDHYGALSFYEKGETIARQGERYVVVDLLCGRAEAALALEDVVLAENTVMELRSLAPGEPRVNELGSKLQRLKVRATKS